jgi:phosphoribosyl 1,2-cyclic phosphodiesterase
MSLELCVLGSGSSGNCSVLRTPGGAVLIDAGLGPRVTQTRLKGTGLKLADVRAICLTHLDHDHFNGNWIQTICERGIRVFVNSHRLNDLLRTTLADDARRACAKVFKDLIETFGTTKSFEPIDNVSVRAIKLAHDRDGSHGFCIEGFGVRIGYATDLGHVPDGLIECFHDVDLLALESNYDPDMQVNSARPWFLKQRIMGGAGHLSNEQAFDAVRAILDRAERVRGRGCLPSHIVLLHRSRQCNCPTVVRNLFHQDPRVAERLTLSDQYRRTDWLRPVSAKPRCGEQLMLSW